MEPNNSDKPSESFISNKTIIVAGAGMAGLSFTLSLRQQLQATGISPPAAIKIYEREPRDGVANRQGYSLSIRSDSHSGGMQVLQKLRLLEQLLEKSFKGLYSSSGFTMWDGDWNELLTIKGDAAQSDLPASAMRIARNVLRRMLVHALPPEDKVNWSTSCLEAQQLQNGRVRVRLDNDREEECDILIVADGANSKLRASLRAKDGLIFAGAVMLCGTSRLPQGLPKPVDRAWGSVLKGDGAGLFVSPIDQTSAVWSLSYLASEPRAAMKPPFTDSQTAEVLREALDRGKGFKEPFQTLVGATDPSTLMVINAMDKQPFSHSDGAAIIFLGDSNHAMSPFAGNGANMALMDGWELAEQLCKPTSLSAALAAYDKTSMPRSKAAIQMSHRSIGMAHAQGWKLMVYKVILAVVRWFKS